MVEAPSSNTEFNNGDARRSAQEAWHHSLDFPVVYRAFASPAHVPLDHRIPT